MVEEILGEMEVRNSNKNLSKIAHEQMQQSEPLSLA